MMVDSQPDPALEAAMDWLMRVRASPNDVPLATALKRWLAESEQHASAYRTAEKVWRLTGDLGPAHEDQWRVEAPPKIAPTRRSVRVPSIAAALAVLILAPLLYINMAADYGTGTAEVQPVTLPDGSTVVLNAKSALDVRYSTSKREVELRDGQAFFEVKPDATKPFIVHAEKFAVTVVGTAFDVRLSDESLTVAVAHGTVRVGGPTVPVTTLQAGARFEMALQGRGPPEVDTVVAAAIGAWREGRLVVDDVPITEVIDELHRYQPGMILVAAELRDRRVTGIYDLRHPTESIAAAVRPFGGGVQHWTPYVTVVSGPVVP